MTGELRERIRLYVPERVRDALNRTVRFPARRVAERVRSGRHAGNGGSHKAVVGGAALHHIEDILPEDIVVVGYPKSGNTWFQFLVAGAVYGVDTTVALERAFVGRMREVAAPVCGIKPLGCRIGGRRKRERQHAVVHVSAITATRHSRLRRKQIEACPRPCY